MKSKKGETMGRGLLGASLPDMEEPCMLWRMISPGRWSICFCTWGADTPCSGWRWRPHDRIWRL